MDPRTRPRLRWPTAMAISRPRHRLEDLGVSLVTCTDARGPPRRPRDRIQTEQDQTRPARQEAATKRCLLYPPCSVPNSRLSHRPLTPRSVPVKSTTSTRPPRVIDVARPREELPRPITLWPRTPTSEARRIRPELLPHRHHMRILSGNHPGRRILSLHFSPSIRSLATVIHTTRPRTAPWASIQDRGVRLSLITPLKTWT